MRLLFVVVTPVGPVGEWRANDVQVLSPQSRLALFSSFDPFFRDTPAETGNVVTSLQLTLYGIRMNEGSGLGSAILAGPEGVQDSFAVGDEILPGVKLYSVQFDHVIIDRNGAKESLYMDQSVPAETVGGDEQTGNSSAIASDGDSATVISSLNVGVANAVSFQPRNVGGKVTGIIVSPQGDGALFKAAGFRDGDIIVSVNGRKVSSIADIQALKSQIKPGARLSVDVERGANTVPIAVNLGGQ